MTNQVVMAQYKPPGSTLLQKDDDLFHKKEVILDKYELMEIENERAIKA